MQPDDVRQEIRTLNTLRRQTHFWRTGATLAIIAIVLISTGILGSQVYGLFHEGPDQVEFTNAMTAKAQTEILPEVQTIAGQAITDSKPAVQAAFAKINGRVPELTNASVQQLNLLRQSLPERGNKALMTTFGATINKENAKIRAMFPEATDQSIAALISNVSTEATAQMGTQSNALLSRHVSALNAIMADLAKIQATEHVNPQTDQANWEMALTVVNGFQQDLKSLQPAATTGKTKGANQ